MNQSVQQPKDYAMYGTEEVYAQAGVDYYKSAGRSQRMIGIGAMIQGLSTLGILIVLILMLVGCAFQSNARVILDSGQEVEKAKVDHKRKVIEVQYK